LTLHHLPVNAQIKIMKELDHKRQELLDLLVIRSFKYDPSFSFKLRSKKRSDIYIDAKQVTLFSKGMLLVGELIWEKIQDLKINAIGGLTLGADPLAYATAMYANLKQGYSLNVFIVRKEPKAHGTQRWIEGEVKKGQKVVVVDDVVTTGNSVIKAIQKVQEAQLEVAKVVVLVDREEGGREAVESLGLMYEPIFTKSELFERYLLISKK